MRTSTFRRMIGTGLGGLVLGATVLAMAVPAGAADGTDATSGAARTRHRMHLTAEQRQCMADHGVTRPIRPLTKEKIATIKAAATACDVKLPRVRRLLTDDQRQCLADHGVTRPIRPLTKDKVATIKAAAAACDIRLPHRAHRLTAEQRQCMAGHGITRPIRPLTPEKVRQIKDAATACGVTLPAKAASGASA